MSNYMILYLQIPLGRNGLFGFSCLFVIQDDHPDDIYIYISEQ